MDNDNVTNLVARRAVDKNDNRQLTFDDLVDIVKNDEDGKAADAYMIISIKKNPGDDGIATFCCFQSKMNRTESTAVLAMALARMTSP
jgi:hypothetical protein